jgi:hypothetical protein
MKKLVIFSAIALLDVILFYGIIFNETETNFHVLSFVFLPLLNFSCLLLIWMEELEKVSKNKHISVQMKEMIQVHRKFGIRTTVTSAIGITVLASPLSPFGGSVLLATQITFALIFILGLMCFITMSTMIGHEA